MSDDNPYESAKAELPDASGGRALRFVAMVALGIVALLLLAALLIPATRSAREPARRNQCLSQMKQIVLAMHNFAEEHGSFPPAYTVDEEGNRLHSWRTLLLPYLEEKPLYDSIDLTKPWDDPVNQHAREAVLDVYMCPSAVHDEGMTTYLVVTGAGFAFDGPSRTAFNDLTDGASHTMAVVDVDGRHAVHWMSPKDIALEAFHNQLSDGYSHHFGVTQVDFLDGRARAISDEASLEKVRAMLTIAGGEDL